MAKTPATRAAATRPLGDDELRVRMYRVGFGDCFLVSLPHASDGATHAHVLVDCGVHARGNLGTIRAAVENIAEVTGKRLAVVVATHAHQDHIAGFGECRDLFAEFDVAEVWLPWTWDPANPDAVKIQKKQARLVGKLRQHFAARGLDADSPLAHALANLAPNSRALDLLKSGFNGRAEIRYLTAGDVLRQPASIRGLVARVLGPPVSESFLAQMDPPAGQHYLRMDGNRVTEDGRVEPFAARWRVPARARELAALRLSKTEQERMREAASEPLDALAFTIDQARNNESVVALLSYGDENLLFAGDAEYGNWRWWIENMEASAELLEQVTFFKVAHHGSINATPPLALESMRDDGFAAMVSTQSKPWKSIPRVPLMQRLAEKTGGRVVRSDWIDLPDAVGPSPGTEPPRPARLPRGFSRHEFWMDYVVKI